MSPFTIPKIIFGIGFIVELLFLVLCLGGWKLKKYQSCRTIGMLACITFLTTLSAFMIFASAEGKNPVFLIFLSSIWAAGIIGLSGIKNLKLNGD